MAELIAERLSGRPYEGYRSAAMQRGTDMEPIAQQAYSFMTDNIVEAVGFVQHPKIKMSGASPDGLVGRDGLIEGKVPLIHTHVGYLISETVPGNYLKQIQWQMACMPDRAWCDWFSYCPDLPETMALLIKRVHRDDKAIATMEEEIEEFLNELDAKVETLRNRYD